MALWGDVNVAMNRLVAEGVIARFGTNLAARRPLLALHVVVSPPGPVDTEGAERIRGLVAAALEPLTEDVTVTVDQSGAADSKP
ncbi:MAG TPA: hypothetical protein VHG30_06685 [Microvirga sp.]|jgi:hypothetical protein|nr:hypothetical protein [Microvirga sp.]